MIYVIGSLKNQRVPLVAQELRTAGHEVFCDWYGAGELADEHWQAYEQARGRSYGAALGGILADHNFGLDKYYLDHCDVGLLVMPAGRDAHLELGYMVGRGKRGLILLDGEPDHWSLMAKLALVCYSVEEVLECLPC